MKTQYLDYVTIRGEFPQEIPSTHILLRSTAVGEGTRESYYLLPKSLWYEFQDLRTRVEQEAQLVYEVDEDYSPRTSVLNAYEYERSQP